MGRRRRGAVGEQEERRRGRERRVALGTLERPHDLVDPPPERADVALPHVVEPLALDRALELHHPQEVRPRRAGLDERHDETAEGPQRLAGPDRVEHGVELGDEVAEPAIGGRLPQVELRAEPAVDEVVADAEVGVEVAHRRAEVTVGGERAQGGGEDLVLGQGVRRRRPPTPGAIRREAQCHVLSVRSPSSARPIDR